ncbi:MAG: protein-L-isoaspartate(D-aspartate) O-methyltransferase, partial [Pseudomonadales bacterium]
RHPQQNTADTDRRKEQESNQAEKNPPKDVAEATDEYQPPFDPPTPPASSERIEDRQRMVDTQIAGAPDRRSRIRNEKVLEAMRVVPRHVFVPLDMRVHAYKDTPLPIGHGQTISQPYIVAMMTELLELSPQSKVLEIGTGSAYQAAVLAQLTPHVYTIEIIEALADRAKQVLKQEEYDEVHCRHADGYNGWEEEAPFDAIIVTCASGHLPPPLWDQLKPGGRIVIPIGGIYEFQRLVVLTKQEDGSRRSRTITSVRFVPMTRAESP